MQVTDDQEVVAEAFYCCEALTFKRSGPPTRPEPSRGLCSWATAGAVSPESKFIGFWMSSLVVVTQDCDGRCCRAGGV